MPSRTTPPPSIASRVRGGALALATAFAAGNAHAAPRPFHPDAARCPLATAAQLAWLPSEWTPFARAVRACRVSQGTTPGGLRVVSVWEDDWYAPLPASEPAVPMPAPLLMSPDGRVLGALPANFPDEQPMTLQLRFVDWRDGLPREVRLCQRSPTVSGDQPMATLRYDASTRRYEKTTPEPEAGPRDECHVR